MNANNAAQYLPLVQALADGKTIQLQTGDDWFDIEETKFNFAPSEYRIKPEPREIWVNRAPSGIVAVLTWESEEEARKHAIEGTTPIRFREVLE